MSGAGSSGRPFWENLPKILGALTAFVTAIATLFGALEAAGKIDIIGPRPTATPTEETTGPAEEITTPSEETTAPEEETAPETPPSDEQAIEDAITAFGKEMRYALENNDTSRLDQVAKGDALADRERVVAVNEPAGCNWEYENDRGIAVDEIEFISATFAIATVRQFVDGRRLCGGIEVEGTAFEGPCTVEYKVEKEDDKWWVTDRELVGEC